jgi:hypothetical protein
MYHPCTCQCPIKACKVGQPAAQLLQGYSPPAQFMQHRLEPQEPHTLSLKRHPSTYLFKPTKTTPTNSLVCKSLMRPVPRCQLAQSLGRATWHMSDPVSAWGTALRPCRQNPDVHTTVAMPCYSCPTQIAGTAEQLAAQLRHLLQALLYEQPTCIVQIFMQSKHIEIMSG